MKNSESKMMQFSLQDIAAWQLEEMKKSSPVVAGIPSLQRGAVWDAQQVEMLWDSIFRNFPIGSIVLSARIGEQSTKSSAIESHSQKVSHHILDGQQRTNAIAWGFNKNKLQKISEKVVQCLWLDLNPKSLLLKKDNSRHYFFRVTTKAHPWGFKADALSSPIGINKRIKFIEDDGYKDSFGHFPMEAGFPIPLASLWPCFVDGKLDIKKLRNDVFYKKVLETLDETRHPDDKCFEELEIGLKNAMNCCLIGLIIPEELSKIEDIEQIFLRLNRQGTPLDNEEIIYSMIKAYWPGIDQIMSEIDVHHAPEARMVSMGVRVALQDETDNKNSSVLPDKDIKQIRTIFRDTNNNPTKQLIKDYFDNDFKEGLQWIDKNFLYGADNTLGIPAYLRSSIAWYSKDVFTWLLWLAKKMKYQKQELGQHERNRILAVALSIHWFAKNKKKVVTNLVKKQMINVDFVFGDSFNILNLSENDKESNMHEILTPHELQLFLKIRKNDTNEWQIKPPQLLKWTSFWQGCVNFDDDGTPFDEDTRKVLSEKGLFVEKLKSERELLVFGQADYISTKFKDFDPSNRLMWKGHNRPWDYDHILPSNKLRATGRSSVSRQYQDICVTWQQSIGNLVAVDLSFNRSANDSKSPSDKYQFEDSIKSHLIDKNRIKSFDIQLKHTHYEEQTNQFVLAVHDRFMHIYRYWFDNLGVEGIVKK